MHRHLVLIATLLATSACTGDDSSALVLPPAGGDTTTDDRSSAAFEAPAPNLDDAGWDRHLEGDVTFERTFVSPPSEVNAGLGPVFNHRSCAGCHVGNGRGRPVAGQGPLASPLLVRVSLAEGEPEAPGGAVAVPGLGTQIGDHAIFGYEPEATVAIEWQETRGAYDDGTTYSLRAPRYLITLPDGSALPADVMTSGRTPPPVFGLGLLEAIPEDAIVARADPDDDDGDGISGRPNRVFSGSAGAVALGRFGVKANNASLLDQAAGAYAADMGVSSSYHPEPDGGADVSVDEVELSTFYTQTLAVPRRLPLDAEAERGFELFLDIGCASCHTPVARTGDHDVAALRDQDIAPFTDLLLHDMGEGLADGRPDFAASGREWRTPPLWGIGLVARVLGAEAYLHDGRARSLAEAILWHGGEARPARDTFAALPATDRAALEAFLRSL